MILHKSISFSFIKIFFPSPPPTSFLSQFSYNKFLLLRLRSTETILRFDTVKLTFASCNYFKVSLALMDAGIPLRRHVAGISVELVSRLDSTTGITDYRILTDLSGLEDHLVDMDLKVAGTRQGVTAVQLDMKHAGVPLDVVCNCLAPALKGRLQILDLMEREINLPRFRIEQDW
ncbi:hypothetical protein MKX03_014491 [Papaver bracteatum]|nr:hypothetical protein MKX03_014491 [Papaver bracteatum]